MSIRPGLKPVTEEHIAEPRRDEADWFDPLWRSRWLLAGLTLAAGVLAYAGSSLMSPVYEAVSTLRLVESKLEEGRRLVPSLPSLGGVRALVETSGVAAAALERFNLGAVEGLTRGGFLERVTTEQVPGSSLVRIRVRMQEADRAAAVANWLATKAIESNGKLNQQESAEARDFIGKQLAESLNKLRDSEKRLLEFKQSVQLDLVKKDIDASLKVREDLLQLRIDVEAERARLARAEADLAKTERVLTWQRTIDRDPALMEAARAGTTAGDRGLLGLQLAERRSNPVYEELEKQAAISRAKLGGLEEQLNQAVKTYGVGAPSNPRLQRMYRDEITLRSLEAEYELLRKIYSDLANRYEIARIQVASQSSELQLVDPALTPERPIAPRRLLNTVVAAGFGFVFAGMWVYLLDAAKRRRR